MLSFAAPTVAYPPAVASPPGPALGSVIHSGPYLYNAYNGVIAYSGPPAWTNGPVLFADTPAPSAIIYSRPPANTLYTAPAVTYAPVVTAPPVATYSAPAAVAEPYGRAVVPIEVDTVYVRRNLLAHDAGLGFRPVRVIDLDEVSDGWRVYRVYRTPAVSQMIAVRLEDGRYIGRLYHGDRWGERIVLGF
jgi:hypothetical protein